MLCQDHSDGFNFRSIPHLPDTCSPRLQSCWTPHCHHICPGASPGCSGHTSSAAHIPDTWAMWSRSRDRRHCRSECQDWCSRGCPLCGLLSPGKMIATNKTFHSSSFCFPAQFIKKNQNRSIFHFLSYLNTEMARIPQMLFRGLNKISCVLQGWYHCCWCLGHANVIYLPKPINIPSVYVWNQAGCCRDNEDVGQTVCPHRHYFVETSFLHLLGQIINIWAS